MGVEVSEPLQHQITTQFDFKWTDCHICYLGTKIENKLNRVMPRLLYLLQTLPIKISSGFLRDLRSRFLKEEGSDYPSRLNIMKPHIWHG